MDSSKELKREAVGRLRLMLPSWEERLREIDGRLVTYFDGLCWDSGYGEGEKDLHNVYEVLAGLRFLRQMDRYVFRAKRVRHVLETYEGVWKDGLHVSGGFKLSGMRGMTHYQLTPVQVFMLAAVFGPHYWYATGDAAEDRMRGDGTLDLLPTERVMDGEVYDLRMLCIEVVYFIPRKFCKTTMAAFFQVYFFIYGDHNAEGYCVANSLEQAKILFKMVKSLLEQLNPGGKRIRITQTEANWKKGQASAAKIAVLSAGGKTKDGLFAQICSADEFGASQYVNGKSDMAQLVNVVEGSMGPRRERLTIHTSTAGIGVDTPYEQKIRGLRMVLEKELEGVEETAQPSGDERTFPFLLQLDEWEQSPDYIFQHPEVWKKVNPHIGITVQRDYYQMEIEKSRIDGPDKEIEVLSKLFNTFQTGKVREWLSPDDIRPLQIDRRIDDCKYDDGWIVFCGLDFSKGDDLNGVSYLAYNTERGEFFADMDSYMSEAAVNASPIRELLLKWAEKGYLHIVPGQTFDPSWPVNRIIELDGKGVNFMGFGYDPYNAKVVMNALSQWVFEIGLDVKQMIRPVRQNFATYNPAVGEFDYMVKRSVDDGAGHQVPDPLIHFSMNSLWPWEFGNVMLQESCDGMENLKPVKRNMNGKVDNIQMLLSALILYDEAEGRIEQ